MYEVEEDAVVCLVPTEISPSKPRIQKARKKRRYYLGEKYPGVYLTPQEAKCLFYVMQKFNSRKIGEMMKIHHRTVEYYRDNIRTKMNADSKKELIEKIRKTNFMPYMRTIERMRLAAIRISQEIKKLEWI